MEDVEKRALESLPLAPHASVSAMLATPLQPFPRDSHHPIPGPPQWR